MTLVAGFLTRQEDGALGVMIASDSACVTLEGRPAESHQKLVRVGRSGAAALAGARTWKVGETRGLYVNALLQRHANNREMRLEHLAHVTAADAALHISAAPLSAAQRVYLQGRSEIVNVLVGGINDAGDPGLWLGRVRYQQRWPGVSIIPESSWGGAVTLLGTPRLGPLLGKSADPSVQAVLPLLSGKAGADLPTPDTARRFFGRTVDLAIEHAREIEFEFRAAWPIDVCTITTAGVSERQFGSLEELRQADGVQV